MGDCHELSGIARLDRPAIEDGNSHGRIAKHAAKLRSDVAVCLRDLTRRRRKTCPDGPHWLIGDHGIASARCFGHRAPHLLAYNTQCLAAFSLIRCLPDADDGHEMCAMGCLRLASYQAAGFAMPETPFGMTDDDGGGASILQHLRGEVAGIGTVGLCMTVLSADADPGRPGQLECHHQQGGGRTYHDVAGELNPLEHGCEQPQLAECGSRSIHLPVSRHQGAGPPVCRHACPSLTVWLI